MDSVWTEGCSGIVEVLVGICAQRGVSPCFRQWCSYTADPKEIRVLAGRLTVSHTRPWHFDQRAPAVPVHFIWIDLAGRTVAWEVVYFGKC